MDSSIFKKMQKPKGAHDTGRNNIFSGQSSKVSEEQTKRG